MFYGQGRYSNRPQRFRTISQDDDPAYVTWYQLMEEAEERRQVQRRNLLNHAVRQLTTKYVVIPGTYPDLIADATNAAIIEMGGRVLHTAESQQGDISVHIFKTACIIYGQTVMMTICVKQDEYVKRSAEGEIVRSGLRSIVNTYASEYYTEEEGLSVLNWVPRRIQTSTVVYSPDAIGMAYRH